jgi:hypothetical protein
MALLALVVVAAACSDAGPGTITSPTSAFPDGSTSGATGASGPGPSTSGSTSGGLTSGSASGPTSGSSTSDLTEGEARFELSGDVSLRKTLPVLVTGVFSAPPGALAIVWTAGGTDASTIGIGGASFMGTRPTSATLTLSLTAQSGGDIWSFLSMDGECQITIGVARPALLSGELRCSGLVSDAGEAVDVAGSFRAAG